jgi:hypothetical protein
LENQAEKIRNSLKNHSVRKRVAVMIAQKAFAIATMEKEGWTFSSSKTCSPVLILVFDRADGDKTFYEKYKDQSVPEGFDAQAQEVVDGWLAQSKATQSENLERNKTIIAKILDPDNKRESTILSLGKKYDICLKPFSQWKRQMDGSYA